MTGNRLVAMELALANENLFKSGTVRDVPPTLYQGHWRIQRHFTNPAPIVSGSFFTNGLRNLAAASQIEWKKHLKRLWSKEVLSMVHISSL